MARRTSRVSLSLLGTLLSIAVGCSSPGLTPGQSEGDGDGSASSGGGTEVGGATSTADDASTTTAHVVQCGDGVHDEGEWCFERLSVDIAELGLEQAFRVIATPDGLIVWGDTGFSLLSVDDETPSFADEPFYKEKGYPHGSVIFRAKFATLGTGRPDLIFWQPVEVSPEVHPSVRCQVVYLSPGASRPPADSTAIHQVKDFDCARDEFRVEVVQLLDFELPCPPAAIHSGDLNGDGFEDAIVLAPQCPATEAATLYTFAGLSTGQLDPQPQALSLQLQTDAFSLEVLDHNSDGFDDLLVAESGQLLLVAGSAEGLSESQTLPVSPVEVIIDGLAHIEDSERPILTIATGQLDTGSELEVLTSTDVGITAVSPESGVLGEFPDAAGSFAAFDINADGVSDVAVIVDQQVVVYRSNP